MKSREEILEKFVQIQQWKNIADRQHQALIEEIDRLNVMSGRKSDDLEQIKVWAKEHEQQAQKIKSLQAITIPGFCANQNIVGVNSLLEGMLASFSWVLEVGP